MGDLKTFVKNIVRDVIKTDYPSMDCMHPVPARITSVQQQDVTHCYTVKLLDKHDGEELPHLVSDQVYQEGDEVVIQFVAGIHPYIVGRWYG